MPGLENIVKVVAGFAHSFAIDAEGNVWGWGWDVTGQLGDGTTTDRLRPVRIPFSGPVEELSAGLLHSVGVVGGQAYAWGWNALGQLGDGTTIDHLSPAPMKGATTEVVDVAAGTYHTLVTTSADQG